MVLALQFHETFTRSSLALNMRRKLLSDHSWQDNGKQTATFHNFSTSRRHRRPGDEPFWTKNSQTWQACQRSKVVQKGLKETKMVNPGVFDHLGPLWAHLDPSGPFQTKMIFLPQMDKAWFCGGAPKQKINFCLKQSKRD